MDYDADEISSIDLLKALWLAVGRRKPEEAHDIRVTLASRLCAKHMPDAKPTKAAIQAALKAENLQRDLSEADVLSGWYFLQSDGTPPYCVIEQLVAFSNKRPNSAMISMMITDMVAESEKFIEGLKRLKDHEKDVEQQQIALQHIRDVKVSEVLLMWEICEAHGVPPFPKVARH